MIPLIMPMFSSTPLPWKSHLLKVLLFLFRVCVVKAHDEFAFKRDLVVLVEEGSLGVTDVQISAHTETIKPVKL